MIMIITYRYTQISYYRCLNEFYKHKIPNNNTPATPNSNTNIGIALSIIMHRLQCNSLLIFLKFLLGQAVIIEQNIHIVVTVDKDAKYNISCCR